jgi:hypothetical protein
VRPIYLLIPAAVALAMAACKADVQEGCLSGLCPSRDTTGAGTGGGQGGGGAGGDAGMPCPPLPMTGDIPCDVFAVINGTCDHCHVNPPKAGAPFSLLSYADVLMPYDMHGKLRYQRMHEVIQPDGSPHMPFKSKLIPVPPLTDAELTTLDTWLLCPQPVPAGMGCGCPGNGCVNQ